MNLQQVLELYAKPTRYETENDIQIIQNWRLFRDYGDIRFYTRTTEDGGVTLLIVHKAGTTENWCGWILSENQANIMAKQFPWIFLEFIFKGENR